jgi:recombinational DNA repair protein (RecF pathway)
MKEYFTEALVLDEEDAGELDKLICLYTEKLGKAVARAKSARKITSKLAGHLQSLNFIKTRLVQKNGLRITDALAFGRAPRSRKMLEVLGFVKDMTFEFEPDKKIWLILKKTLGNATLQNFSYAPLLSALGFAPDFASCAVCKNKSVFYFSKSENIFLCKKCGRSQHAQKAGNPDSLLGDLIKIQP